MVRIWILVLPGHGSGFEDDGEDSYVDSYAECMLIHYEVYLLTQGTRDARIVV